MKQLLFFALVAGLAGCGAPQQSMVATLDVARLQANWPMFINYSNQLASDTNAIQRSSASARQKQKELDDLRRRFVAMQDEVTGDVRNAAAQVAAERHLKLIVTRQFVGYGGVDITPDVEKILKITETASPAP